MNLTPEIEEAVVASGARVRFHYPWWLRLFLFDGVVAITLGRRIYVSPAAIGETIERLLRHELEHVRQVNKAGLLRFYIRYGTEYVRNLRAGMTAQEAYRNISFEREAYAAEEVQRFEDV